MQYIGFFVLIALIAAGLTGCNEERAKINSKEDVYVYSSVSDDSKSEAGAYSDEYEQKKRAQTLTLGGKREDGLHYIDYTNPNYMDIVIFTKRAQDYLKRNGTRRALEDFMSPDSQFVAGRMYVFAYSVSGECLADWAEPGKIGRVENYSFMEAARKAAELGGGWVDGSGVDPVERELCQKESYIVYAGDGIIIGSGLYKKKL